MTVPTHATTAEVPVPMPRPAEPAQAAAVEGQAVTPAGTNVGRRALKQFGENPLLTLFGTAIIALLIFNLNATNDRISSLEDRVTRLEERMDARFAALEEDMAELKEGVAELDRKLTAVIAALNMTEEVTAAIEGRIGDPATE